MKFLPSAICGFLLALPLTASSTFAQSSTTAGASGASKTQAVPSAPAAHAPASERGITSLNPAAPVPPAHPITMEQTRELLDLMNYKKIEDGNWVQMIAMNKQAAPFIPEDVWTDVQSGVSSIDYPTLMQPIYAKYLSQEDAAKALVFYRTPEGRRVLQSMPPMLGESVAASQQKGRQVGREAIEKHRPEIEAAQKKYQADHAPKGAAPGAAPGTAAPNGPGASPATPAPSTPPAGAPPAGTAAPKPQR